MMLSAPLAALALPTTCSMSSGARNWPFLMLTGRPDCATVWMKSVCRHRNAGVCSTSTTLATAGTSSTVCTSVSTGTPIWRFTSASTCRPSSMPGPRKLACELRFALSYDDLKMNGTSSAAQISFSVPAVSSCNCIDSTTQGPAIRNSGRSRPTSNPHSFIGGSNRGDELADHRRGVGGTRAPPIECRAHEADEQRMPAARIGREFGVELAAEEPAMTRNLDHFAQVAGHIAFRICAHREARGLDARQVVVVDLVAMAMAFGDDASAVNPVRKRAGQHVAGLRPQSHRAAQVGVGVAHLDRAVVVLPLGDQRDHRMRRGRVELGAVGVGQPRLVTRVFDHCQLHTEADAEVG